MNTIIKYYDLVLATFFHADPTIQAMIKGFLLSLPFVIIAHLFLFGKDIIKYVTSSKKKHQ